MSNNDKVVRIVLAIVMAVLFFTGTISGVLGIILLVVSGIFVATSLVSFCPLYRLVGISTCSVNHKAQS